MHVLFRVLVMIALAAQVFSPTRAFAQSENTNKTYQRVKSLFPETDRTQWGVLLRELNELPRAERQSKIKAIKEAEVKLKARYDEQLRLFDVAQSEFTSSDTNFRHYVPLIIAGVAGPMAVWVSPRSSKVAFSLVMIAALGTSGYSFYDSSMTWSEFQVQRARFQVMSEALHAESEFIQLAQQYFGET